jgi:cell division protein ZapA (FtsZ GTPase activity inhibitor)
MKVQITIRGRTYTVKSDEDGLDLPALARYVDTRMAEVSQSAPPGMDDYTVAMLACLNIASDFERFRRLLASELDGLDQEVVASSLLLRGALAASPVDNGAA